MRLAKLLALLLGLLFAAVPAQACTISATGVAFGAYNPRNTTSVTGVGSIQLDCHPNGRPVISLGAGNSGSYASRRMTNGISNLNYNLYVNSAMTIVWGNGTGGTQSVDAPRKTSTTTVYGRIPPRQNVTAGTYRDTLVVSVVF